MHARELEDRYVLPTYAKMGFVLARGEGNYVFDEDGRRYLDLYGGHAVAVLGHSHPRWVEAIARQARELGFYSSVSYLRGRGEAARALVERSYPSMAQVFFCNSGAEANETALKMARKATGRPEVIALEGGFHGRTLGALSVTAGKYHRDFPDNLAHLTRWVPFGDLEAARAVDPAHVAAVILEPVQSMSGVRMAPVEYYRGLAAHCRDHGMVLIFDEVQTGAGRTGRWFFGGHVGVEPDLVTCAKGIGGGFPVGAVIASRALAATVKSGDQGSTFGGGPLACAAVRATFEVLESEGLVERAARIGASVLDRLRSLEGKGLVRAARGLGYMIGVDAAVPAREVQARLRERGILIGGSDVPDTFRLLPPLTVGEAEWEELFRALESWCE
ncbi:MAG: aspartate aminotransferase family protein [Thermoanaerobaculia bacterium]